VGRKRRIRHKWLFLFLVVLCLPPLRVAAAGKDAACLSCHEGRAAAGRGGEKQATRPMKTGLRDSVHRALACTECHRDVGAAPTHRVPLGKVDCSGCHGEEGRLFGRSVHGAALKRGDKDAPSCTSCHGDHYVLGASDQRSSVFRANLITVCARCHTDVEVQKRHNLPSTEVIKAYAKSVHGRLLEEGRQMRAAVCSDCHGSHLILDRREPESKTNREHIPEVCGRCHVQIYNEYKVSIHGRGLKEGKAENPTCTDCHGEHTLTLVSDPKGQVYVANVAATCAKCHANQTIIRKYGLPSDRYSTYVGSFHGVAVKYGDLTAANCTSCHEVHRILPAAEAESSINPQNLGRTCGKCHPAMKGAVSIGRVHVEAKKESSLGMYFVRRFYVWFIGILMALFICYIALDVYGRIRRRKSGQ
jgi:5-methylcytosine-specific restriction endonuclease McrA